MVFSGMKNVGLLGAVSAMLACGSSLAAPLTSEPKGATVPQSIWDQWNGGNSTSSLSTNRKRSSAQLEADTFCRTATNGDLNALSDAQFQVLINNANTMFDKPLTTLSNVRVYRQQMFQGRGGGGYNGYISQLRNVDITDYEQDGASICLDGLDATLSYNNDATCNTNTVKTYGVLGSTGGTVQVSVAQGYLIDATVSTTTTNGQNWGVSRSSSNENAKNSIFTNSDDIGGGITTSEDFFVDIAVNLDYSHTCEYLALVR
jgi:hypothetical protein